MYELAQLILEPALGDLEEQHAEPIADEAKRVSLEPATPDAHLADEAIRGAGLDHPGELLDPLVLDAGDGLADRASDGIGPRDADHLLPGRVHVDVAPVHDAAAVVAHRVADQHAFDEPVEDAAPVDLPRLELRAHAVQVGAVAEHLDVADVAIVAVAERHHLSAGPEAPAVLPHVPALVVGVALLARNAHLLLRPPDAAVLGREDAIDLVAEHLVGAPAQGEFGAPVPVGDPRSEVGGDHREVDRALEDGPVPRRVGRGGRGVIGEARHGNALAGSASAVTRRPIEVRGSAATCRRRNG